MSYKKQLTNPDQKTNDQEPPPNPAGASFAVIASVIDWEAGDIGNGIPHFTVARSDLEAEHIFHSRVAALEYFANEQAEIVREGVKSGFLTETGGLTLICLTVQIPSSVAAGELQSLTELADMADMDAEQLLDLVTMSECTSLRYGGTPAEVSADEALGMLM